MRPFLSAAFLAVVFITTAARAQVSLAEVEPGSRIKFRATPRFGGEVKGTVLERHGDSLKVFPGRGNSFSITLPEVEEIAISRGKSRMLGAGVGALWGAGIYAALGLSLASSSCDGCEYEINSRDAMVAFAISGASVGALIGVLVGRERWERLILR